MVHTHLSRGIYSFTISTRRPKAHGRKRSAARALPGVFAEARTAQFALQFCEHTLSELAVTINAQQKRFITALDLKKRPKLCVMCSLEKAKQAVCG